MGRQRAPLLPREYQADKVELTRFNEAYDAFEEAEQAMGPTI